MEDVGSKYSVHWC